MIDDFDWRFRNWRFWLTILIDDWLTILLTIFDWRFWIDDFDWRFLIDDFQLNFDWRFLIDDFDWRFLIDDFWLTIFDWRFLIDDFDWRFLIDDFDWRFSNWRFFELTIFDWRFWLTIFDWRLFWLTIIMIDDFDWRFWIDDFDWRFLIEFSNLESWTQYFYSLFSKDRSWRSELSKWLKIMYVVQNLMLFKMIPLSINLNGNFPT